MLNQAPPTLGDRLASLVVHNRLTIVVFWLVLAVIASLFSPDWKSIAYDGDFEYLPASMPSVAGTRLLDQAFPTQRSRSQIVLVVARDSLRLTRADEAVSLDLLRHLYHRLAEVTLAKGDSLPQGRCYAMAREFLDAAIRVDELYFSALAELNATDAVSPDDLRITLAYWDRAQLLKQMGEPELAASDLEAATVLDLAIADHATPILDRPLDAWSTWIDMHSWQDSIIGSQFARPEARLAILMSDAELAATSNIGFLAAVEELRDTVLKRNAALVSPGLEILATGSAAIGGETLTAARDAIRYTEWLTVLMILAILGLVYRAPLLVVIPVVSIAVAIAVSSGLVAWLTVLSKWLDVGWFDFRVFTTSRIFVVVILFGAGTDFCLFLISRLREEAALAEWSQACRKSLAGVSSALVGSALTTIVGLAMLFIAQFGKFHYTGPIIALCLAIGLLVCLTFTPAMLALIGPKAFWPSMIRVESIPSKNLGNREGVRPTGLWGLIALRLTRHPWLALSLGIGLLVPPAWFGFRNENEVTYDISSQLDDSAESRRGLRILEKSFDIGAVNPTTILVSLPAAIEASSLRRAAKGLSESLYGRDGVLAVRSADDPLGDFPPDRAMGLLSTEAWKRRALKTHRAAQNYFFSDLPQHNGRLVRLDVVIDGDPFGIEAAGRVTELDDWLHKQTTDEASPFFGSQMFLTGTTPSIIDLRAITLSDNRRIKVAVVIAVFIALWVVIRRFSLCGYLIATVLLTYYATLGLTILFYRIAYGDGYVGLDWKLPLFLFVILVAVGQDYNVYLVTRIIEEQRERGGWLSALRRAVARTGGIITACGIVMAATFFSMTASAWLPGLLSLFGRPPDPNQASLRGIVELGFALGLGVMIDTFYVRTVLVPSFVAVMDRASSGPRLPRPPDDLDADSELA